MKHFFLSILLLLSSTLCAGVEETRNKNPSYISLLVSNGELKELSINNNPLILSTLQENRMLKEMKVLLFPGDIISVKASTKEGVKGGIFGSIKYIDENNNQIEIYTGKDKWVCDKSIPAEEEPNNSKEGKFIWGANYQEDTICEVQIPCKGHSGTSNDETKSNLRTDNSDNQIGSEIIKTPETPKTEPKPEPSKPEPPKPEPESTKPEPEPPKPEPKPSIPEPEPPKPEPEPSKPEPEPSNPEPSKPNDEPSNPGEDESKKPKTKVIKRRRQSTITPSRSKVTTTISKPKVTTHIRKPLVSSIPSHIIKSKIKKVDYNGHTYICNENRKRAYRVDNGVTKCISSKQQYVCTYFNDIPSCVAYMKSNKPKYEIIDKDYTKKF